MPSIIRKEVACSHQPNKRQECRLRVCWKSQRQHANAGYLRKCWQRLMAYSTRSWGEGTGASLVDAVRSALEVTENEF
jgi:hypothetical protein